MESREQKRQRRAAVRTEALPLDKVVCVYCGEQTASGSFKGYAHRWGPTSHTFIAKVAA